MTFSFVSPEQKAYNESQNKRYYQDAEVVGIQGDLVRQKALDAAKKAKSDYESGVKDPAIVAPKTDLENYTDKSAVDLTNQKSAWETASKLKQSDAAQQIDANKALADQSNVAQKDRLIEQLSNQKQMQTSGFDQTNKLRSDDNQRAIDGFKMNF